jgi:hypothetical protein
MMRRRIWLALPFLLLRPDRAGAEEQSFSEAMGTLGQERSYAEFGAGILKTYAPADIDGRQLYAQAKAAFDGLIDQLLTDLAQNRDPTLSPMFRERLDAAVNKRVAFSQHVDQAVKAKLPEGAKPGLIDALAKVPAELIKELFAGGISIWREWSGANKNRRDQIATRLEALRWKPFADVVAQG